MNVTVVVVCFGYLGDDDVHLPAEFPQRVHQLFRIFVDSDPTAIHKDLSGTKKIKRQIKQT